MSSWDYLNVAILTLINTSSLGAQVKTLHLEVAEHLAQAEAAVRRADDLIVVEEQHSILPESASTAGTSDGIDRGLPSKTSGEFAKLRF